MKPSQKQTWCFFKTLFHAYLRQERVSQIRLPLCFDGFYFLQLLDAHRLELALAPLVQEMVKTKTAWWQLLQQRCYRLAMTHLQQRKALRDLSQGLHKQGIPHVVLKGLPLNAQLYQTQCRRRSRDIDILIARDQLAVADACLKSLGFILTQKDADKVIQAAAHIPSRLLQHIKDYTYQDQSGSLCVELHLKTCFSGEGISLTAATERDEVQIDHHRFYTLAKEENFFYLCEHAAKHHWQRLQWLTDLAVFYQKNPLQWPKVVELAKQQGQLRALLEARRLLDEWFELSLPAVPSALKDQICTTLRLWIIRRQWPQRRFLFALLPKHLRRRLETAVMQFLLLPSWNQRWHVFMSVSVSNSHALAVFARKPPPLRLRMALSLVILRKLFFLL